MTKGCRLGAGEWLAGGEGRGDEEMARHEAASEERGQAGRSGERKDVIWVGEY